MYFSFKSSNHTVLRKQILKLFGSPKKQLFNLPSKIYFIHTRIKLESIRLESIDNSLISRKDLSKKLLEHTCDELKQISSLVK